MTPNLLLATQTLFSPHKWFNRQKSERPTRKTEHWDSPVPGIYEYIPGRGWYLVATDKDAPAQAGENGKGSGDRARPTSKESNGAGVETIRMTQPVQVKYSKVLKRYLLAPDYEMRKKYGDVQDFRGKWYTAGFFRLDDGIAWVECWDEDGEFIPGPYKLWCIDQQTGKFRHMLRGDDPAYMHSRHNSFEGEPRRRRSQDSRSTQYRNNSKPGSQRDGPSVPSTRANSIKAYTPSGPTSHAASRGGSRRNSPKRSPSIPLDEAKERLKKVAAERAALSRGNSMEYERGRSATPAAKNG
jgi:hypothetical protein